MLGCDGWSMRMGQGLDPIGDFLGGLAELRDGPVGRVAFGDRYVLARRDIVSGPQVEQCAEEVHPFVQLAP